MTVLLFKKPKRRRKGWVSLPQLRVWEIEKIIRHRRDRNDPMVDPAVYVLPMARIYREIVGDKADAIAGVLMNWARVHRFVFEPEDIRLAADTAVSSPRLMSADALGQAIHLSYYERHVIGIKSIGAFDVSKAQRERRRRDEYNEQRRERRAKERSGPTREQWLAANRATRDKPWVALGISRPTYYRRLAASQPVRQVVAPVKKESLTGLEPQPVSPPPRCAERPMKWLPTKVSRFSPQPTSTWPPAAPPQNLVDLIWVPVSTPTVLPISS